jgi:hypothetical protein
MDGDFECRRSEEVGGIASANALRKICIKDSMNLLLI